jgi:hypothetical protein
LEIATLHLALISLIVKPAYPQLSPADFDLAEDIAVRLNQTQDPREFFYGIVGFLALARPRQNTTINAETSAAISRILV